MSKNEKKRQQRVHRRELLQLLTESHHSLHTLLTRFDQPTTWNVGTPKNLQEEWTQLKAEVREALLLGFQKGIAGAKEILTTTGPKAWQFLVAHAHHTGYELGRWHASQMAVAHRIPESEVSTEVFDPVPVSQDPIRAAGS